MLGDFAVILQCFLTRGLLIRGAEGNVANLKQFRRSKERHVRRIVVNGIDYASFINDDDFEASFLRLNTAS